MHKLIELSHEKLDNYVDDYTLLPALSNCRTDHGAVRERTQKRERRDAIVKVMKCLLEHMDFITMMVGVKRAQGAPQCLGVRLDTISEKTGLCPRRVDRCIAVLERNGFISSSRRTEQLSDGMYKGRTSVRVVSEALFKALGLHKMLKRAREYFSQHVAVNISPTAKERAHGNAKLILEAGSRHQLRTISKILN